MATYSATHPTNGTRMVLRNTAIRFYQGKKLTGSADFGSPFAARKAFDRTVMGWVA